MTAPVTVDPDADPGLTRAAELVRDVPDFPEPGILFRDITPVLADAEAFAAVATELAALVGRRRRGRRDRGPRVPARGGRRAASPAPASSRAQGGQAAAGRRVADLPAGVRHRRRWSCPPTRCGPGTRVFVVDDVLATGGTAAAACELLTGRGRRGGRASAALLGARARWAAADAARRGPGARRCCTPSRRPGAHPAAAGGPPRRTRRRVYPWSEVDARRPSGDATCIRPRRRLPRSTAAAARRPRPGPQARAAAGPAPAPSATRRVRARIARRMTPQRARRRRAGAGAAGRGAPRAAPEGRPGAAAAGLRRRRRPSTRASSASPATRTSRTRWPWRRSSPSSAWTPPRWWPRCCTTRSRTPTTRWSKLRAEFGEEVAHLVDGVTKLDKVELGNAAEAETIRKMVVAMARDPRVLVIKLADRLHNMRTMRFLPPEKQAKKARETLEVLAPLAHRLGMATVKWELEDLSFAILHPKKYSEIVRLVADPGAVPRHVPEAGHRRGHRAAGLRADRRDRRGPAQALLLDLPEDDRQGPRLRRHPRPGRACACSSTRCATATPRWAWCTRCGSRCPAGSRTTSRSRGSASTSRCTPP